MFEELYALAILYANGFDTGKRFQEVLNEMTLEGREDMLELQYLPLKDAAVHTLYMADNGTKYDPDTFGRYLMRYLRETWEGKSLDFLGEHLYTLWRGLPESLQYEYPILFFCYADDEAGFCREKLISEAQCRMWFEDVFNFYENGKTVRIGISLSDHLRYAGKLPPAGQTPEKP